LISFKFSVGAHFDFLRHAQLISILRLAQATRRFYFSATKRASSMSVLLTNDWQKVLKDAISITHSHMTNAL